VSESFSRILRHPWKKERRAIFCSDADATREVPCGPLVWCLLSSITTSI
jgi:hypothetical protein